jgi:ElaB/YqjD/DUF883 family membrane-anchored ribosome-binding protein
MSSFEQWMTIFDAAVSVAVILQMVILFALFLAVKKALAQMNTLSQELREKGLPAIDAAHSFLKDTRPKVDVILEHATKTTEMARLNMAKLDHSLGDVLDRGRKQIIRTDEMVSRTLDRVEQTTELVQRTVVSPVRRISAVVEGITAGLEHFLGKSRGHRNHRGKASPDDDLFI